MRTLSKLLEISDWRLVNCTQDSQLGALKSPVQRAGDTALYSPALLAARITDEKILIGPLEVQEQQPFFPYQPVVNICFLKSPW